MNEAVTETIREALHYQRDALTKGLNAMHSTPAERELFALKIRLIDNAIQAIA